MPTETKPVETEANPQVVETPTLESEHDQAKQAAKAELQRRAEITALCKLAKVTDENRDLMIQAGFSRAEAQDYLKSSGQLSVTNPPVSEGGNDLGEKKKTQDELFGEEFDEFPDIHERMGVTREAYIASRKRDN